MVVGVTKALVGRFLFTYSRSALRISFGIDLIPKGIGSESKYVNEPLPNYRSRYAYIW